MLNSQLHHLIRPPETPIASSGSWGEVAAELTALPSDYMAVVAAYGAGCFDGFIWLFSPFAQNSNLNLLEQVRRGRSIVESLVHEFADNSVPSVFPVNGGLLPFAISDNGDYVCWETAGEAENWKVAIWPARSPTVERTQFTASQFLVQVLSGGFRPTSFPKDFPSRRPSFRSAVV